MRTFIVSTVITMVIAMPASAATFIQCTLWDRDARDPRGKQWSWVVDGNRLKQPSGGSYGVSSAPALAEMKITHRDQNRIIASLTSTPEPGVHRFEVDLMTGAATDTVSPKDRIGYKRADGRCTITEHALDKSHRPIIWHSKAGKAHDVVEQQ